MRVRTRLPLLSRPPVEPQSYRIAGFGHQLESPQGIDFLERGVQRQRRDFAFDALHLECHHIIRPALQFEPGRGVAARTRLPVKHHAIGDFIADVRLRVIEEVRQQYFVGLRAIRDRMVVCVHGLNDNPIVVDVEVLFPAFARDGAAFGAGVGGLHITVESVGKPFPR